MSRFALRSAARSPPILRDILRPDAAPRHGLLWQVDPAFYVGDGVSANAHPFAAILTKPCPVPPAAPHSLTETG